MSNLLVSYLILFICIQIISWLVRWLVGTVGTLVGTSICAPLESQGATAHGSVRQNQNQNFVIRFKNSASFCSDL